VHSCAVSEGASGTLDEVALGAEARVVGRDAELDEAAVLCGLSKALCNDAKKKSISSARLLVREAQASKRERKIERQTSNRRCIALSECLKR
jgi:hypothetical protein